MIEYIDATREKTCCVFGALNSFWNKGQNHRRFYIFLGTDDQVQVKFLELLSENFHPVHSVPDIHFLKDEKHRLTDSDNDEDDVAWTSGMHRTGNQSLLSVTLFISTLNIKTHE